MKKIYGLFILMMLSLILQGCSLSTDMLKLEEPVVEIEDKLVGVYIQILEYNNQGDLVETLPLFGEEGYLYVIHQSEDEDQIIDIDDIMSPDIYRVNMAYDVHETIIDGVTKSRVKETYDIYIKTGSIHYGKMFQANEIKKVDGIYEIGTSSNFSMVNVNKYSTKLTDSFIDDDIEYTYEFIVHLELVDDLSQMKIIEFNDLNEVIRETIITEPILTFETLAQTSYVIVEEKTTNNLNQENILRNIYSRGNVARIPTLFLNSHGFVPNQGNIQLTFK